MPIKETVEQSALSCNASGAYLFAKRSIDIVLSILGIMLSSPVFILVLPLMRICLHETLLLSQECYGLKGKKFVYHSIRTDFSDAGNPQNEKHLNGAEGEKLRIKHKKRVCRAGRLIKKCHLGKLPLLFAVLKGNMSFVGPRTTVISEVVGHEDWYNLRMSVKPGITGFWHIYGKNGITLDEVVRLDLKYIRERNLKVDARIFIKTVHYIFSRKRRAA